MDRDTRQMLEDILSVGAAGSATSVTAASSSSSSSSSSSGSSTSSSSGNSSSSQSNQAECFHWKVYPKDPNSHWAGRLATYTDCQNECGRLASTWKSFSYWPVSLGGRGGCRCSTYDPATIPPWTESTTGFAGSINPACVEASAPTVAVTGSSVPAVPPASTDDHATCIHPANADVESWDCECFDIWSKDCPQDYGLARQTCLHELACNDPVICQSWKDSACSAGSLVQDSMWSNSPHSHQLLMNKRALVSRDSEDSDAVETSAMGKCTV
jgi:hypothetical protein